MDWSQLLTIIGVNAGLFFWARSESRQDYREIRALIDAIRDEIKAIQLEMRDFHSRLCDIEKEKK